MLKETKDILIKDSTQQEDVAVIYVPNDRPLNYVKQNIERIKERNNNSWRFPYPTHNDGQTSR